MKRLRGKGRLILATVLVAGVFSLALLPGKAYVAQYRERQRLAAEAAGLAAANRVLEDRARVLDTDAEIERLARTHYNLAYPGEESYAVLPAPTPVSPPPPRGLHPPRRSWDGVWDRIASVF